jgi:hypothetical protein
MPIAPGQKPVISERAPGRMFDIFEGPEVIDLYADGSGRLMVGPQVAKVEFYRLKATKTEDAFPGVPIEERETFCRLVIPTPVLAELCGVVIDQLGANMGLLDAGHQHLKTVVANAIRKAGAVKL